jgi:hypothetical protein
MTDGKSFADVEIDVGLSQISVDDTNNSPQVKEVSYCLQYFLFGFKTGWLKHVIRSLWFKIIDFCSYFMQMLKTCFNFAKITV